MLRPLLSVSVSENLLYLLRSTEEGSAARLLLRVTVLRPVLFRVLDLAGVMEVLINFSLVVRRERCTGRPRRVMVIPSLVVSSQQAIRVGAPLLPVRVWRTLRSVGFFAFRERGYKLDLLSD